jgi:hypothetical protein
MNLAGFPCAVVARGIRDPMPEDSALFNIEQQRAAMVS